MRKLAAVAAALIVAAGIGVVAVAGTANAPSAPSTGTIRLSTNVYSAPHSESPAVLFGLQPGQKISIVCFTEGESVYAATTGSGVGQGGHIGLRPQGVHRAGRLRRALLTDETAGDHHRNPALSASARQCPCAAASRTGSESMRHETLRHHARARFRPRRGGP